MKKLLNTLYVTTQGAYLSKEGECVLVSVERQVRLRLPVHTIGGIICFGNVSCSPFLMGFCAEKDVGLSFLTENGRFLARVKGEVSGNVLLRRQQFRMADDETASAAVARSCLIGKIANSRTVLRRFLRDHAGDLDEPVRQVSGRLEKTFDRLKRAMTLDELRGIEGDSAGDYFSVFDNLITTQKEDFIFSGRNRRPPLDKVNALLSFLYTLLAHDVSSALESVGLDPAVGFLHRDRPGRDSLALDIMEEMRSFIADRLTLSMINLRQITAGEFKTSESGAVTMDDNARKKILVAYQERKRDEIMHPYLNEKISVGLIPFVQSLLLARFIRGDIDAYPPFIWR
jgi:CRISPR-associated protein Cas1